MTDRFFLDTSIFVYTFDRTEPRKAALAQKLVRDGLASQKGVVSYQVVQEFLNVALRRFAQPMQPAEAERYITAVFRPLLAVHSSVALFAEALRIHGACAFSWFDSLVVASALQAQCGILYTEDLQHGQKIGPLRIVNPFL
jgi:predicted nucleic acid-binding protein